MARRWTTLPCAAALALGACTPDAVTAPTEPAASESALAIRAAPAEVAALGASIDDAGVRLVPSLGDAVARAELTDHLGNLSAAVAAGDVRAARRALALARRTVGRLSGAAELSPDAADLAAVELALDQAAALLEPRTLAREEK